MKYFQKTLNFIGYHILPNIFKYDDIKIGHPDYLI